MGRLKNFPELSHNEAIAALKWLTATRKISVRDIRTALGKRADLLGEVMRQLETLTGEWPCLEEANSAKHGTWLDGSREGMVDVEPAPHIAIKSLDYRPRGCVEGLSEKGNSGRTHRDVDRVAQTRRARRRGRVPRLTRKAR